jgi:GNAT superfamily N-acetyltransferase
MTQTVVTTYLELTDPAQLRPAAAPAVPGVVIARSEPPDGALNRLLYHEVGGPVSWTDHLAEDRAWWDAHAAAVATWVMTVGGLRAGYAELQPGPAGVELVYFGLLPGWHGRGLGGHLLTFALLRGLEMDDRVWVHTCTLDGPAALPNYLARGMRIYRRERS